MLHDSTGTGDSGAEDPESIEIPNSEGARKSKLGILGETIRFPLDDLQTTWDAIIKGHKLSGNGRCFGWRNFKSSYEWISYGEFIKKAEIFGSGLVKIGLNPSPSSFVGIYAQNGLEWVVAQFGVWRNSSAVVPLYDTLGPDASTHIIKQAEIKIVICDNEDKVRNLIKRRKETPSLKHIITTTTVDQEVRELALEKDICLHTFNEIENLGQDCSTTASLPQSSDVALICFTSGTTGVPKGVVLTHENLISLCYSFNLALGKSAITKEDSVLSYLPLAHIFGQFIHVVFLMVGARIGFFNGDCRQLLDDIRILQPTVLPAVPRLLNKWYDEAQWLIQSNLKTVMQDENFLLETEKRLACKSFLDNLGENLRLVITGAAPIYSNVVEFYTKFVGCKVLEIYGQTECAGPCCGILLDSSYDGCAGAPLPCCIIKLVDVPDMGYFSKNSKGEVCIKGKCVFKEYLKDPEKTAETLDKDGWLHSGDIGMWLPNGTLKIIDRKKNILKLAQGLYVAPEKIETIYALSQFVSQVYVYGESLKNFLVAIVIPDKDTVMSWCKENLKCNLWNEICNHPAVKKLIFEDMLRRGKELGLNSIEQVKAIHCHPEVLTFEAGFLTPTLKMKRDFCKKYFAKEIEILYSSYNECV
ncbi:long-chain-fatty-acid--CoA ligase 1-like isoform X2 [Argiope bruennichi]|uniref:long-chain-fatty-acid--CoA ligase n=2 Tax=Argiope bruennichi TaxID=94029 RepID=A0A8T0EVA0_ARGBR|nr:long-chain-fatty-acid--CoA ligase 1-like isoform X2 [Argiope bruennichi]KAF8782235.1 Long-chain-fatty-acid--CoA ligase 1 like protein [Argiope bruennichi]